MCVVVMLTLNPLATDAPDPSVMPEATDAAVIFQSYSEGKLVSFE